MVCAAGDAVAVAVAAVVVVAVVVVIGNPQLLLDKTLAAAVLY